MPTPQNNNAQALGTGIEQGVRILGRQSNIGAQKYSRHRNWGNTNYVLQRYINGLVSCNFCLAEPMNTGLGRKYRFVRRYVFPWRITAALHSTPPPRERYRGKEAILGLFHGTPIEKCLQCARNICRVYNLATLPCRGGPCEHRLCLLCVQRRVTSDEEWKLTQAVNEQQP